MPKMNQATAAKVAAAESESFEALPEDRYLARLRSVEAKDGQAGVYWRWEFEVAEGPYENRRLWVNTSLSERALWKLNEVFSAFGATPDTDTDELCGKVVALNVTQRVIESGSRKGEIGNNVERVSAADDASDDADDDLFDED